MNEEQRILIKYRLEQAEESYQSALLLFNNEKFRPAVNRAYYAMFYSVLALLVTGNQPISKHSGVISVFDKEYIKTGIFDKKNSQWIHEAFDLRQRADYTELFTISRERAQEIIHNADIFCKEVGNKLNI